MSEQLLTRAEVAKHLRVSARTISRMVTAGELVGRRIGRSVRIAASSVPGYLEPLQHDPSLAHAEFHASPFQRMAAKGTRREH